MTSVNDSTPWPLRGSQSFDLRSKAVGDTFAIGVWQPDPTFLSRLGVSAAAGLDVLYLLDGAWALNLASSICMLQLADLIRPGFRPLLLVGVDYPAGRLNARTRDYTMPDDGSLGHPMLRDALKLGSIPEVTPGGADQFLAFLETELDPLIRARYQVADGPGGLFGVSYGGSLATYAFIRQSRLFNRYWLGSPGLFTSASDWPGQFEKVAGGPLVHDTRMFLSFGELEAWGGVPFYEDMGRNFGRITNGLARHPNPQLTARSKLYPGHTHTSIVAPAMNDALLTLYGSHQPE